MAGERFNFNFNGKILEKPLYVTCYHGLLSVYDGVQNVAITGSHFRSDQYAIERILFLERLNAVTRTVNICSRSNCIMDFSPFKA